jgi:hypothetical protein
MYVDTLSKLNSETRAQADQIMEMERFSMEKEDRLLEQASGKN